MDYSRIHPDQVTRLSDIVVERCVSRCVLRFPTVHVTFLTVLVLQILGFYSAILSPVLRVLRMASRAIHPEHHAARGHVPLLYLPPSNT